ncbi:uncharacterized protein T551_01585 [Pneumocystis jirovecii RU7]|uniref:AP complex subunit beta n=2 Tax=Pneumocystis jirovecii TaxID=42068 RepID=A0A0W4ZRP2_PNEJ7|nr:uncharacterized protein T551_01585 [Pneumocystis jirovecii RU7]KTW31033.1 hypothetical protein T551_01585 [Pneumocystis jirovecii RU7]
MVVQSMYNCALLYHFSLSIFIALFFVVFCRHGRAWPPYSSGPLEGQVAYERETYELGVGLVSQYAHESRKEAIQRTIAAMTLGKDVSGLFPDVLKNIATPDLAQKKLVYLYLMNYAKTHQDLCILAVNTFVQDSEDPNPLIRALAIRTMGCIRVNKIVDYLFEPLRKTLRDNSAYVRKTAAICVAKLFDISPEAAIENGFLEILQELLNDTSPMVISNAMAALIDINERMPSLQIEVVTSLRLSRMLSILNESTEWERVMILGSLSEYTAANAKEAENICEYVTPQFQHANMSVVMAAIRVVMRNLPFMNKDMTKQLIRKITPSLVTLVSSIPEVQYVALRNINLILQEYPNILNKEIKVFFCKYNDLEYVKLEKLDIIIKLANKQNIDLILMELKEYASEVDVDFVRRSIKIIAQCAIKIEESADRCVNLLLNLINTKVNYVVQESVIVIKDIFRKYPHTYDGSMSIICENMSLFDEPNAKSSFIWIVGEYSEKISNSRNILASYIKNFKHEDTQTQLQLLTATVKLFLKSPSNNEEIIQRIFEIITTECDIPDIRDRAYIYWRLLSSNFEITKEIVLSNKIPVFDKKLSPHLLKELILEFSTLSSVFHKLVPAYINLDKDGNDLMKQRAIEEYIQINNENKIQANSKRNLENLLDIDFDTENSSKLIGDSSESIQGTFSYNSTKSTNVDDLLGVFGSN